MRVHINELEYEANEGNTVIFTGETMLSGIYTDIDDDYVFVPEGVMTNYSEVTQLMTEQNIPVYELDSYDPEAQPFCFMINALCRIFRQELDVLKVGDED